MKLYKVESHGVFEGIFSIVLARSKVKAIELVAAKSPELDLEGTAIILRFGDDKKEEVLLSYDKEIKSVEFDERIIGE